MRRHLSQKIWRSSECAKVWGRILSEHRVTGTHTLMPGICRAYRPQVTWSQTTALQSALDLPPRQKFINMRMHNFLFVMLAQGYVTSWPGKKHCKPLKYGAIKLSPTWSSSKTLLNVDWTGSATCDTFFRKWWWIIATWRVCSCSVSVPPLV
jgi:hypothetical protein